MDKIKLKNLTVLDKKYITKNMLRITLYGDDLNENFDFVVGCYIKLLIPTSGEKPKMRVYTVRRHDSVNKTIDIDFAIHFPAGPATNWALNVQLNETIEIMGPGVLKINPNDGDWYLFSVDMSALPAAISVMETLDEKAKGYAFIEVLSEEDKQPLNTPKGIEVKWILHSDSNEQLSAIKNIKSYEGKANVFIAGELGTSREIKYYLKNHNPFPVISEYISSYWKVGSQSEEHKAARKDVFNYK